VKGPLQSDDALLPLIQVILHEAGANAYEPGPANFGVSVSPCRSG
jgi:hypothetical protein